MNRNLAGTGAEDFALDADDVTDIPLFESGVTLFAEVVARDVKLDFAFAVGKMCERGLAHDTAAEHSARHSDRHGFALFGELCLVFVISRDDRGCRVGHVKFRDDERIVALRYESGEFVTADLQFARTVQYVFFSHVLLLIL